MTRAISGAIAFFMGALLAFASVAGILQLRSTSTPTGQDVQSEVVDYGTNQ